MNVIISSCQKYQYVCQRVYESWIANSDKFVINIYSDFAIENLRNGDVNVVGNDFGWNQNLIFLLSSFSDDEIVILTMDDLLVTNFDELLFDAYMSFFGSRGLDYLSLYAEPIEQLRRVIEADGKAIVTTEGRYILSTMVSAYRVGFLKRILNASRNPWEFERFKGAPVLDEVCGVVTPCFGLRNIMIKGSAVSWRLSEKADLDHLDTNRFNDVVYTVRIVFSFFRRFSFLSFVKFIFR